MNKSRKAKGRPGTAVLDFFARFPNSDACDMHIFSVVWGDFRKCDFCGESSNWKRYDKSKKYYHPCGEFVSPRKGTIFYRSNLSLMAWFYALLLFSNSSSGMRSSFIRKQLGIGVKSSHRMCNQIRAHFAAYDRPPRLGGPGKVVQIDEALIPYVATRGQGARSVIVMGISCEGIVLSGVSANRNSETIIKNIQKFVIPGSRILTDAHKAYQKLGNLGWNHGVINHSKAFHNFMGESTTAIDVFWSVLKRTMRLYRQASHENFWRFLAEVEFRYNHRFSSESIFNIAISRFPDVSGPSIVELRKRYVWTE